MNLIMLSENELLRDDIWPRSETVFHDMDVFCASSSRIFFFLVHHFNAQMYNEFRSLALDDIFTRGASDEFLTGFFGFTVVLYRALHNLAQKGSFTEEIIWYLFTSNGQPDELSQQRCKKTNCFLDTGLKIELEKLFSFFFHFLFG